MTPLGKSGRTFPSALRHLTSKAGAPSSKLTLIDLQKSGTFEGLDYIELNHRLPFAYQLVRVCNNATNGIFIVLSECEHIAVKNTRAW